MDVLRVLLWVPAIFLASYIVAGAVIAFVAAFWMWLLFGVAFLVGIVLLAAHVS